ncbi:MAG: hypothetical protein HXS52_03990 [Theionarchaea archaeon]|nr:hypothetical protein [Theionarchaea archaeon]
MPLRNQRNIAKFTIMCSNFLLVEVTAKTEKFIRIVYLQEKMEVYTLKVRRWKYVNSILFSPLVGIPALYALNSIHSIIVSNPLLLVGFIGVFFLDVLVFKSTISQRMINGNILKTRDVVIFLVKFISIPLIAVIPLVLIAVDMGANTCLWQTCRRTGMLILTYYFPAVSLGILSVFINEKAAIFRESNLDYTVTQHNMEKFVHNIEAICNQELSEEIVRALGLNLESSKKCLESNKRFEDAEGFLQSEDAIESMNIASRFFKNCLRNQAYHEVEYVCCEEEPRDFLIGETVAVRNLYKTFSGKDWRRKNDSQLLK